MDLFINCCIKGFTMSDKNLFFFYQLKNLIEILIKN